MRLPILNCVYTACNCFAKQLLHSVDSPTTPKLHPTLSWGKPSSVSFLMRIKAFRGPVFHAVFCFVLQCMKREASGWSSFTETIYFWGILMIKPATIRKNQYFSPKAHFSSKSRRRWGCTEARGWGRTKVPSGMQFLIVILNIRCIMLYTTSE